MNNNPFSLNQYEMPMYEAFIKSEGRRPNSMLELMNYSAGLQQINAQERQAWKGIFDI